MRCPLQRSVCFRESRLILLTLLTGKGAPSRAEAVCLPSESGGGSEDSDGWELRSAFGEDVGESEGGLDAGPLVVS